MPRDIVIQRRKDGDLHALAYDCWEIQWLPRPACFGKGAWLALWNKFNRIEKRGSQGLWRKARRGLKTHQALVLIVFGFLASTHSRTSAASESKSSLIQILEWGDVATWVTAILTAALTGIAWVQFGNVIEQQKEELNQRSMWASLQTADKYDSDPVIVAARDHVMRAMRGLPQTIDEFALERAFITLFNFFDSIAIGLKCGMYHEGIMKQHTGDIIVSWIDDLRTCTNTTLHQQYNDLSANYEPLCALYKKWK
jgi:hypothetical protein